MPHVSANGINIYYEVHGQGEALFLIAGLGANTTLWDEQIPVFAQDFRVVAFDGFITRDVVEEVRRFLRPPHRDEAVERNFELGREHFSFQVLRQRLLPLVEVVG
jgi:hypothetical protein